MRRISFGIGLLALALSAPAHAADEPLKIGVILPQTGVGAVLADQMKSAYELAVDHLGGKVGGRNVELVFRDSQGKPDVGKQVADELIKSEQVDLVSGVLFSHVMMAVHGAITRNETFLVGPVAGPAPLAGERCNNFFFNVSSQNDSPAEVMGHYLDGEGVKSVYVMAPNYQAGKDMVMGFKREFHGDIAGEVYTKFGQLDFSAELSALRAAEPKATFVFYPGSMGVQFVKQYHQAGLSENIPLYVVWTVDQASLPAIGDAAIGVRSANVWSVDSDNPENKRFVEEFSTRYGFLPNDYAAHSYDAVMLIDSALKKVGGSVEDKDALRDALRQADFKSVRGDFKFGSNQFPVEDFIIREVVKDGDGQLVTKTIAKAADDYVDAYAAECHF